MSRIPQLEGLRGLLACYVAVHHLYNFSGLPYNTPWVAWLSHGDSAVHCFIILSGFVIFHLLEHAGLSYSNFLVRRFFRIWPVFMVCFLAGIFTAGLEKQVIAAPFYNSEGIHDVTGKLSNINSQQSHLLAHIFASGTLLHGVIPEKLLRGAAGAFLGPGWSIAIEWQFYLVAPLIYLLIKGGHPKHRALFIAAVLATLLIGDQWKRINVAFLPLYANYFAIGALCQHVHSPSRDTKAVAWSPASLLVLALFFTNDLGVRIWSLAFLTVVGTPAPLSRLVTRLGSILASRPLTHLGKISYSIYLIHWPLFVGVIYLLMKRHPASLSSHEVLTSGALFGFPLLYLASLLSWTVVEKPMIALGRRLSRTKAILIPTIPIPSQNLRA